MYYFIYKLKLRSDHMFRPSFLSHHQVVCLIQGDYTICDIKLNDFYSSPNIVPVIKSRRMRRAGHVARMGEERGCIGSWWGNRRKGHHWGDLGLDGWIILGWISRRWDVCIWTGLGLPRIETGGGRL